MQDKDYILKDKDVCTIRQFPSNDTVTDVIGWVVDPVGSFVSNCFNGFDGHSALTHVSNAVEGAVGDYVTSQVQSAVEEANRQFEEQLKGMSFDSLENVTDSSGVTRSPALSGYKNQSLFKNPYPFILGKTYCAPFYIGNPYTTLEDSANGSKYQIFHCLYMLGYNHIHAKDFALGLYKLASNSSNITSGFIPIDGDFNKDDYKIKIEIQDSDEVSIYNQKVVQTNLNVEMLCEKVSGDISTEIVPLKVEKFSARYPHKIEVEFLVNGLGDRTNYGEEYVVCEYSLDGGETYTPLSINGAVYGYHWVPDWSEPKYCNKFFDKMCEQRRYVAQKEFTWDEIKNCANNTVEIRAYRLSPSGRSGSYNQGIILSSIRTWCYDNKESKKQNTIVPQRPIVEKDRKKTTRVGFEIKVKEDITDLKEFNCILQALGRTFENGVWSDTLSETCNPASMALLSLQSEMRGTEKYEDYELDLDDFGEFYNFCKNYDIKNSKGEQVGFECNGILLKNVKTSDFVSQILSIARGYLKLNGSKYGIYIDRPQENPVMILNNQNVIEATNQKTFDEEIDGISCSFINEDNYYLQDEAIITTNDNLDKIDLVTKRIDFIYQTNIEQIYKNALFELAKYKLRPEIWIRKVTTEGSVIEVGSLVSIQDDTICVGLDDGAEVKKIIFDNEDLPTKVIGIETDGNFEVTDLSLKYGVEISVANGFDDISIVKREVVIEEEGIYNTLIFESPILLDNIYPTVGDIVAFGVLNRETIDAICVSKDDDGDGTYTLNLVPYSGEIYNVDSGVIPEFDSLVTVPQHKSQGQNTDEKLLNVYREILSPVDIPSQPSHIAGIIEQDKINFNCLVSDLGTVNTIKYYEWKLIKHNGQEEVFTTDKNTSEYLFNRAIDGYIEPNNLDKWTVSVRVENIYGIKSEWTDPVTFSYAIQKSDYTWTPQKPVVQIPLANKDGFTVDWTCNKKLGTNKYVVRVYKEGELLKESKEIVDTEYQYTFNRNIDGYPEESDLRKYRIAVVCYNEAYNQEHGTLSDSVSLNLDYYGTWEIGELINNCVSAEVNDRTVTLKMVVPTSDRTYYGSTQFRVSIKRVGVSKAGSSEDYPIIEEDTEWYKPDLYSSPLNNELAYRTNEIDGFELSNGRYSQTMPLAGQSTNNISDTIYRFKIVATNEAGKLSNVLDNVYVTALCTSIRDIVKSNEDYKNLYVTRLSALNANVGLISQGGFGNFEKFKNFWALTKMLPEDTGLSEIIKEGAFRVGDEKEYIAVIPPDSSFGEGANKITNTSTENFMIQIKAGNITLTTTGTSFDGGTYIYNESHNKRMKMSDDGLTIEQYIEETDSWDFRARLGADTDGNLTITNSDDKDSSLPKKGVYVPENRVYHLEGNFYDSEGNICTEFDFTTSNFEDSTLLKEYNKLYVGDIIKNEIAQEDVCLLNNSNLIKVGNAIVDLEQGIVDNSVDYWNGQIEGNYFVWGNE